MRKIKKIYEVQKDIKAWHIDYSTFSNIVLKEDEKIIFINKRKDS